jgi:hypothetical protein
MKQFCVYSLKRSGQHAIINWFLKNFEGSHRFFNNINSKKWKVEPEDIQKIWNKVDCLICNVEDYDFSNEMSAHNFIPNLAATPIFVFRNPYNLVASRIAHTEMSKNKTDLVMLLENWKVYAKNFLQKKENYICFDYWFSDKKYRDKITQKYFLNKSDLGIDEVLNYGNGSSFDATNYDGNAQQMRVLDRFKSYEKEQEYLSLFDDEVRFFSDLIFSSKHSPFRKKTIKII